MISKSLHDGPEIALHIRLYGPETALHVRLPTTYGHFCVGKDPDGRARKASSRRYAAL